VFFDTLCVLLFPFFNFLFLKLQFMRIKMYTIFLALFVQRSESQFVARHWQEDSERSAAAAQLVSTHHSVNQSISNNCLFSCAYLVSRRLVK